MTSEAISRNDEGASLILILGLVVVVSMIMAGLFGFMTTTVRGRVPLDTVRNRQYAADGAVEHSITQVRLGLNAGGPMCAAAMYQHNAMHVDCTSASGTTSAGGFLVSQENAIFAACPDIGAVCTEATIIIRAQVNFQRPTATGPVIRTFVQSWSVNQ